MDAREISRRKFFLLSGGALGALGLAGACGPKSQESTPDGSQPLLQQGKLDDAISDTAKTLGRDLTRIFEFVRNEVRYQPYAGVLRGARGTLLAGAGNSVDQALLLAALLRASGTEVRFVTGQLDSRAADALMASTVADAESARRVVEKAVFSPTDLASDVHWPVPANATSPGGARKFPRLNEFQDAFARDVKASQSVATERLRDSVTTITKAISSAGIQLPRATTVLPSIERTAHTWVQARQGTDWIDLDPAFIDAQPGKPVATSGSPAPAIPDTLRHTVTFTVIAESVQGGQLKRSQLLETSGFADELNTTNIAFTHVPSDQATSINILKGAGSGKRYYPALIIGPNVQVARQAVSIGGAGSAQDAIGDALGGGGGGPADGETSAEWLEVRLTAPGAKDVVTRREIFDRVSSAARHGGVATTDAVSAAELLDLKDGTGQHYLPCRSFWAFHVSGSTVNFKSALENIRSDAAPPLSLLPASYHALRSMLGSSLATGSGCVPFCETPHVSSWAFEVTKKGFVHGLDIWHRGSGTLSISGVAPTVSPALVSGVLSHVVERVLLGEGDDRVSVGALFERAASQGIQPRVFKDRLPDSHSYAPEHRARIQTALDAGSVVVVPERAVDFGGRLRLGWWLVDPQTGAAVDELDNGRGAVMQGTGDYVVVAPAAGALGVGLSNYGWHMWNVGNAYIQRGGPNAAQVSQVMGTLANLLFALCPPGTPCR